MDNIISFIIHYYSYPEVKKTTTTKKQQLKISPLTFDSTDTETIFSFVIHPPLSLPTAHSTLYWLSYTQTPLMDRYHKIQKVGEGAYGIVYQATDNVTGATVALKEICIDSSYEGVPATAIREVSLLKVLRHDNIVKLLDVCQTDMHLILVFEYIEQDLRKYMDKCESTGVDAGSIQHFLRDLLKAICFCHQQDVLHRDLKPQNLLISRDKELKLADFGLGRSFGIPIKKLSHEVVTLWYRPPDVLLGSTQYGTTVDMWSIGCIFAEMVFCQPLFAGKNDADQLLLIFKFLGTPNTTVWPSMHTYPNSSNMLSKEDFRTNILPQCEEYFSQPRMEKLRPEGIDLLRRFLRYEPSERISAEDALRHPYFSIQF